MAPQSGALLPRRPGREFGSGRGERAAGGTARSRPGKTRGPELPSPPPPANQKVAGGTELASPGPRKEEGRLGPVLPACLLLPSCPTQ